MPFRSRGRRAVGVAALAGGLVALSGPAWAAEVAFAIPLQARESALMLLARQAGLSLGFAPGARCDGRAGVTGRLSVEAALARLLDGSACVAVRTDARTIVIRPRPASALAQSSPRPVATAAAPTQLGELVVTAGKIETLLSAAPYALTAVTGADLDRQGVEDVRDLSLLAAGVTVTNLGPGRDKVLLRGLSDGPLTGHAQSTVGLYLGELRLTYNAPDPDLPLIDVERVEVLRGPQGSLYGAGSIGGVLQVIPNAPDAASRSGEVRAGLATTEDGAASYRVEGVLNQPLPGGRAAVRAIVWREQDGGSIDNALTGRRDIDRSRRGGVRLMARYHPSDDWTLDATFVNQSITTRDAHYAEPAVGPYARATANRGPHDNDFLAAALTARWTPAWGKVTLNLGALDHDVGTTYDAASAPAALAPAGAHPKTFIDGNEIRAVVAEAHAASVGASAFHWTLGAFGSLGQQLLDGQLTTVEDVPGYLETRRDRLLEAALFGEASYDLTPRLTFTAGGRVFTSRLRTRSEISLDAPVRAFRGRTHYGGFAPKLLLAYRPAEGLTLYAQAAEGYRTPGFNTAGPPGQAFGGPVQPFRRYAGDELWSYEVGGRWRIPDLGLSLRAAVFQADWSDIQAELILPSGLAYTANVGDGRSRGVEAEAGYTRGPLTLSAAIVRQEPELRGTAAGLMLPADLGLPGVPQTAWSAAAAWAQPLGEGRSLDLSASYAYVGRSRLAFDAASAPVMGGYGELRASATLGLGATRLRLYVDNALDRRGDTLAFGNPFSFRSERQTTPQRPRTIGFDVRRAF